MNAPGETSKECKLVWLLCLAAAVHVLAFSAAFPFFDNVDEPFHFDLVLRYSHGHLPRKAALISPESSGYLALMNCHEYFGKPTQYADGHFPPPAWTLPAQKAQKDLIARAADWQTQVNYEVSETPLYYALAALWWHIGGWVGLHDGRLVYWLRFLNVGLVAALVWLGYAVARLVFPENSFVKLSVPALLAFLPQTAFYSIGNDVLSPLCFGVTFLCLLKWLASDVASPVTGIATGLAFAATYLAKITNLPLLAVAAAAILAKTIHDVRPGKSRTALGTLAVFICCAEPPICFWQIWCKSKFGDLTGSALKTGFLGWTLKPFGQWWHHPIFTPGGLWIFLSGQLGTFWEGEFTWHHQSLVLPGTRSIYTVLSLVMAIGIPLLFWRRPNVKPLQRRALGLSLLCFAAALGFFGMLSTAYDFHNCPYPSRSYPYFVSGRLLLGALVPFLILFAYGMDHALRYVAGRTRFFILFGCVCLMLTLEVATDWPALFNQYNWFHLP